MIFEYLDKPRFEWKKIETNVKTGEVKVSEDTNLVTNAGRDLVIKSLFMMSGSAGVICAAVGTSTSAATVADTRLNYEILPAGRVGLTSLGGSALSAADITTEVVTIEGTQYQKKLVAKALWPAGVGTGYVFTEYMLNTSLTSPATPTSTSGVMFNHYIDPSPSNKGADTAIEIQITCRF